MAGFIIPRNLIDGLLDLPARQVWADYDAGADVLYVSFRKPQQADDSVIEDDGNIYHYAGQELVGITVLDASSKRVALP